MKFRQSSLAVQNIPISSLSLARQVSQGRELTAYLSLQPCSEMEYEISLMRCKCFCKMRAICMVQAMVTERGRSLRDFYVEVVSMYFVRQFFPSAVVVLPLFFVCHPRLLAHSLQDKLIDFTLKLSQREGGSFIPTNLTMAWHPFFRSVACMDQKHAVSLFATLTIN